MGTRIKDKDGNEYEIMTDREAEGRTDKPIQFSSMAEAKAFVEQIMATPEGAMQLHQLLTELDEQTIH